MADAKVKISALPSGTPTGSAVIPYVEGGVTKKALKSELDGTDGVDGKTLLSGAVDPTTEGVDGDFYINTATNEIFGPKATVWGTGTSIIGDTGNGISGIALTGTVGLVKTYRITFTDATTFDYDVTDGTDGIDGDDAPEVQYEFSIDGATLWHTPFATGDFYQRISTDGGATWSSAIKFVGENGTGIGDMLKSENLSGLANYTTARSNLGLNTTANQTDSTDKRFMTDAQKTKIDAISGTNTGDQTSIVGITGTKAQFDTAVSDGNIIFDGGALGTPASGTLTNCTFPTLNQNTTGTASNVTGTVAIANGGTGATTLAGASIPTYTSTNTLTNKRITKRVVTVTQSATPAINVDNGDIFTITGLAQAITSFTVTGTETAEQTMIINITDNGTARAITWGTSFEASTVALPTTTVASTLLKVGFIYNSVTSKWRCVAVA